MATESMTPAMWEALQDIALGEGAKKYISEGWINQDDPALAGYPVIRAAVHAAYATHEAWNAAAKALQDVAEALVTQKGQDSP
jgi:hypothetical protein